MKTNAYRYYFFGNTNITRDYLQPHPPPTTPSQPSTNTTRSSMNLPRDKGRYRLDPYQRTLYPQPLQVELRVEG